MVPRCRLLNMGIFRDDSHKIEMSWIQVRVNGSTGLGPGPSGTAVGGPAHFLTKMETGWAVVALNLGLPHLQGHRTITILQASPKRTQA